MALVQMRGMEGIEGFSFSDVGNFIGKAALAPFTASIAITKGVAHAGVGLVKDITGTTKDLLGAFRPPPPPPPPASTIADYFPPGSADATATSSKLPIIIGAGAAVTLVVLAVVLHKRRKRGA